MQYAVHLSCSITSLQGNVTIVHSAAYLPHQLHCEYCEYHCPSLTCSISGSVHTLARGVLLLQVKGAGLATLDCNVEQKSRTGKRSRAVAACTEGTSMQESVVTYKEVTPLLVA